jgi:hypothetical protein
MKAGFDPKRLVYHSNETCDVSDATIDTSFIDHVRSIAWAMFSQGLTNEKSISTGEVFSLSSALVEPDTPIHASGELSEWKAYPYQYSCLDFHPGIDFVHLPTRPAGLPFPPRT